MSSLKIKRRTWQVAAHFDLQVTDQIQFWEYLLNF